MDSDASDPAKKNPRQPKRNPYVSQAPRPFKPMGGSSSSWPSPPDANARLKPRINPGLPPETVDLIHAECIKVPRDFYSDWEGRKKDPTKNLIKSHDDGIMRIFALFGAAAINLGLSGKWTLSRISEEADQFLRNLIVEGEQKFGLYLIHDMWASAVEPRLHQHHEWIRFQDRILALAQDRRRDSSPETSISRSRKSSAPRLQREPDLLESLRDHFRDSSEPQIDFCTRSRIGLRTLGRLLKTGSASRSTWDAVKAAIPGRRSG
jgi:hypothetical protein